MNTTLTPKQLSLMRAIEQGADIWSHSLAIQLRELQKIVPEYLHIGPAMMADNIPGKEQQPYFGAILSDEGERVLHEYEDLLLFLNHSHWDAIIQAERGQTVSIHSGFAKSILDVAGLFPEYVIVAVNHRLAPPPSDDHDNCFDCEDHTSIHAILTETGCQMLAFEKRQYRP